MRARAIFLLWSSLLLVPSVGCDRGSAKDDDSKSKKKTDDDDDEKPKKKKKTDDDDDEKPKKKKKTDDDDDDKSTEGPAGFPLPKGAKGGTSAPGGGGKILVYEVPRGRDAVAGEVKKALEKKGWKIDSEEKSPMGTVRLSATKGSTTVKASITGTDDKAALILTVP